MLRSLPTASPLTSLFAQKRVRMGSRQSTGPSCAISSGAPEGLSDGCKGAPAAPGAKLPIMGEESLMSQKGHGTCDKPVQSNLRWSCDAKLADRICCFNRHYAENASLRLCPRCGSTCVAFCRSCHAGYWVTTSFLREVDRTKETTFYDSVTGKPLFVAPRGRSFEEWEAESRSHGWPSFRDQEVIWDDVRVLRDGEAVSTAGTHLGHNLPDRKGNRYCINLVSVAGRPAGEAK